MRRLLSLSAAALLSTLSLQPAAAQTLMERIKAEAEMLRKTMPAPAPRGVSAYDHAYSMILNFDDLDVRRKFDKAHSKPCPSCAGGLAYDMPSVAEIEKKGVHDLAQKIGATPVGQSYSFVGAATGAKITITVTSAVPAGKWPCKQARITSSKGVNALALYCQEKGGSRDGLWFDIAA